MATTPIAPKTIETLTEGECWARLGNHVVGRLVVTVGQQPDIFPVNYRLDNDEIVVRTAEGTKLAAAVMGERVAFEIDNLDELHRGGWSVVVHGTAYESASIEASLHDEEIDTEPWADGAKQRVLRIRPETVSGRRVPAADHEPPNQMQRSTDQ